MDRVIRQLVSVLAVYAAIGFLALGTGVSASAATLTTSVTAYDSPASVAQVSANGARLAALTGPVREGSSPTVGTSAGRSDFAVAAEDGEGLFASRLRAMRADPDRGSIGDGTPRTNIAQNKQFNDAIKAAERQLGRTLSKDERSAVHREISGQDYGYHDIVDEVLGMFGGGG